jgi:hypothetical protein
MSAATKQKCCCVVYQREIRSSFDCGRNAIVTRDGRSYCGVHDPDRLAIRRRANEARWRAENEARDTIIAKEQAYHDIAVEALKQVRGNQNWQEVIDAVRRYEALI